MMYTVLVAKPYKDANDNLGWSVAAKSDNGDMQFFELNIDPTHPKTLIYFSSKMEEMGLRQLILNKDPDEWDLAAEMIGKRITL